MLHLLAFVWYHHDMYYVYLLQSMKNGKHYLGYTSDLKQRVDEHNSGKSRYTRNHLPWKLVYYEAYETESLARVREQKFKQHGKRYMELLERLEE